MKRLLMLLLLVAVPAMAADAVKNGQKITNPRGDVISGWNGGGDSLAYIPKVDSDGNLFVKDGTLGTVEYYANIINVTTSGIAPGSASVSSAKNTAGWKGMALQFYALPSAATVGYDSYAIQIRGSYLPVTDSTASFPAVWPTFGNVETGVFADTIKAFNNVTPDLDDGSTSFPKAFAQMSEQFIVEMNPADAKRGRVIPLVKNGVWWQYPYTTVRIRPLRGRDGAGAVLASAESTTVRKFRADLVRVQ